MDLPIQELLRKGNEVLSTIPGARIFYKWTCAGCGSRQSFEEPNTLYTSGLCEECGYETKITEGGFDLIATLNPTEAK